VIDTHCHLYLDQFNKDQSEIIRTIRNKGIEAVLIPGIDVLSSQQSIDLSMQYRGLLFTAVGIHPNYTEKADPKGIYRLINNHEDVIVALGEIGLDYYRDYSSPKEQQKIFEIMLAYANEFDLPICLHNREATSPLLATLDHWYTHDRLSQPGGVFHAYDGSEDVAEWGMEHGFYFGIGGLITYQKYKDLQNIICAIGIKNIVLETDAPYLTPVPFRGKRNSPLHLDIISKKLAQLLNISIDDVIKITDQNANSLFGFKSKMPY